MRHHHPINSLAPRPKKDQEKRKSLAAAHTAGSPLLACNVFKSLVGVRLDATYSDDRSYGLSVPIVTVLGLVGGMSAL